MGGRGASTKLRGVSIFEREGGAIVRVIEAERADRFRRVAAGECPDLRLEMNIVMRRPEMVALGGGRAEPVSPWPGRSRRARLYRLLGEAIDELAAAGRPTEEARTGWWHKISGPLSTMLMPLLAATAAFGLRVRAGAASRDDRHGARLRLFRRRQFQPGIGQLRRISADPRGLGAVLLFLLIGEFVLVRQEE